MLVDDQASVLNTLGYVFEFGGYRVLSAGSGAAALALASTEKFDGALIDVHMAGMTGVEVCARLREVFAGRGGAPAVWLMTGAPTPEIKQRAAALGVRNVLVKPFDLVGLLAEIETGLAPS